MVVMSAGSPLVAFAAANSSPTDIIYGTVSPSVAEGIDDVVISTVAGVDPDMGDVLTYMVDDDRFEVVLVGSNFELRLKAGAQLDFETPADKSIVLIVTVSDGSTPTFSKALTLSVTNVNEGPVGLALLGFSPNAVQLGLRRADLFPEAGITDPEDDALTYTLISLETATLFVGNKAVAVGDVLTEAEFEALTYNSAQVGIFGATFEVSDGDITLAFNVILNVSAAVDEVIKGTVDADTLDGGAGNDTVSGLQGADAVYAGNGRDAVRGDAGDDRVYGGAGSDDLRGGLGNDVVVGGLGQDILRGNSGNDRIDGMEGQDILFGGAGDDTFVFRVAVGLANADTIRDFQAADDQILLSGTFFAALGSSVKAWEFRLGTAAQDANDHLIYDKAAGNLYYDANGSENGGKQLVATLADGTNLTFNDFDII